MSQKTIEQIGNVDPANKPAADPSLEELEFHIVANTMDDIPEHPHPSKPPTVIEEEGEQATLQAPTDEPTNEPTFTTPEVDAEILSNDVDNVKKTVKDESEKGNAFQGVPLADEDEVMQTYPPSSAALIEQRQMPAVTTETIISTASSGTKQPSIRGDLPMVAETTESPPVAPVGKTPSHIRVGILLSLLFGISGIVVGIVALISSTGDEGNAAVQESTALECDPLLQDCTDLGLDTGSLLDAIVERGYITCGLAFQQVGFFFQNGVDSETQEPTYAGFDVDLCRAIAAALFEGDSEAYRTRVVGLDERWTSLNSTEIDVLFRPTRTMQRQVYEPSIGTGMEFSEPYFYDGLGFGGVGEFVECAETGIFNGTCSDLKVCVLGFGTHDAVVGEIVPLENMVVQRTESDYYGSFPSLCNVLAGESAMIAEATLRQRGYEGSYVVGKGVYSLEPLCMVTRRGDKQWTHFVDAVLNALIFAEEGGITQTTALSDMPTTDLFGPRFERMFQYAVSFRGNYGEIYVHNLEAFVPRSGLNEINIGDAPRILSYPFGKIDVEGPELREVSPTIKAIKARGFINCGITPTQPGTGGFDPISKEYRGSATDICRAISAALFDGVDRTLSVPLAVNQRLAMLRKGRVDLSFAVPHSLSNDVKIPNLGVGVSLSEGFFYPGLLFTGEAVFVDCAQRLDIFSFECRSLRICVIPNTATFDLFSRLLRDEYLVPKQNTLELFEGLDAGDCNALIDGVLRVQGIIRLRGGVDAVPYVIGSRLFAVVPISIATKEDDPVWSAFVDWILMSLFYAEENGIFQKTANLMPRTNLFGPLRTNALYHAVSISGNYGEIYERNWGPLLPRAGTNLLNDKTAPRLFSF